MSIRNCTPDEVVLLDEEGQEVVKLQAVRALKPQLEEEPRTCIQGVPVRRWFPVPQPDLPGPKKGVILVVTQEQFLGAKLSRRPTTDLYLVGEKVFNSHHAAPTLRGYRGLVKPSVRKW